MMRSTRTISRIAAATLVASLTGVGLATQAAGTTQQARADASNRIVVASKTSHNTLQDNVNTILRTGSVGVLAQSTGPHGTRYATAGTANKATGTAVNPNDRFRIGSATKTYVATVILQLVGEGRLSLDDTVDHWLPAVVSGNGNDGTKITVRQLLQHTSGLFDYLGDFPEVSSVDGYQADRHTTWTPGQLVAIAMRHKPDFAPGAGWEYSNTNYVLAGMIIEKATGHTWQQEVTRRILQPLHLSHTVVPTTDPRIPGAHLHGYSNFYKTGPTIDVTSLNPSAADAAGNMISTTADLTRFYSALLGGKVLRPAELAEMKKTVRAPDLDVLGPDASYGLGLMRISLSCGGAYYGHGGDLPGYTTRDGISADGRRVVVLETTGDGAADLSTEHAQRTLMDQELCAADRK
ncbi:serine hydrolase [Streptomyces sp. NBC_01317]|uniref:serine hydrolase domain-containing protein n=1 Tax=Streptomyces sp. NBC_01317 TaxID=2903822 RepID=UPI002E139A3A|nr:serine hydrolase [Streptomyces sp. NBC_01317]